MTTMDSKDIDMTPAYELIQIDILTLVLATLIHYTVFMLDSKVGCFLSMLGVYYSAFKIAESVYHITQYIERHSKCHALEVMNTSAEDQENQENQENHENHEISENEDSENEDEDTENEDEDEDEDEDTENEDENDTKNIADLEDLTDLTDLADLTNIPPEECNNLDISDNSDNSDSDDLPPLIPTDDMICIKKQAELMSSLLASTTPMVSPLVGDLDD